MSDTKQKALDYLESNANIKEVFGTTDGFIFLKKGDALNHAKALDPDNPEVETFTRDEQPAKKDDAPKLSPAELKALKEKATAEYKELFGTDPDSKLSGAKIQALNDAKKAEIAQNQNPE
ncbi:hypothetical protein [Epilithonimonas arachidiradicis]|uniref:Uncharacterized protein n=1 Tax=Epilithonimonas arachidiradicis TaxID=1617282 RepID=A0A420DDQ1_9FLAO|nr:hypothetical protein [Epilithonimonas arachidiradicis]RKE90011.1 hypothetical protein BXY58_0596 [Epilithonimonas arachidiradicis]GGG47077.1 hypothetical protein GCM10007332_05710 [Epilithonimonas arachidiradicis]